MISYQNISLNFEGRQIFSNLSFEVVKGQKAALKGRSGSGKTSLLSMAMGFLKPDSGKIVIDGKEINGLNIKILRKQMCWLPQSIAGFNSESVSAMLQHPFSFHYNKREQPGEYEIRNSLITLGLDKDLLNQSLDKVSGGEKQRLGIIICKMLKRKIILLDEPTSALDKESLNLVVEYIMKVPELTVLSASHDEEWLKYCNNIIEL
ncbi:MAG: ATP-binding cassette domain-containing protein [Bacteroidetes bacterium]|nr:MAG: ATP-binding cassette domain-containing protein [Bacteroidota bacterium]